MKAEPVWETAQCNEIIAQLCDIARDEGDAQASGIDWYGHLDEVPVQALAELEASGYFEVRHGPRPHEHSIRFSAAGAEFYDPCGTGRC